MNSSTDMRQLAESLSRCLPDLQNVEPLEFVGEGFRSVAVATSDGVLFRVGKLDEAANGFELEMNVLPLVKQSVSAPVPEPQWHIRPCSEFPFGAMGYKKLPGVIPVPGDESLGKFFIPELTSFLVSLHSMPVEETKKLGVTVVDPMRRLAGAKPVVMPVLANRLNSSDYRRLESWWANLRVDQGKVDYQLTVCHHDLWHENLLVDANGHLAGVLDWSHIEIGDPAQSFAAIHHFGPSLVDQFIDAYRAAGGVLTDDDLRRIRIHWEGRHLGALAWAIENNVEEEIENGIRKLQTGPLLG